MTWRTVIISGRAKLDLKLNHMVVRKDTTSKIHIGEIAVLIIDSTTVSITSALISKLIEEKIKIIFCDESHIPVGEIVNYYNKHNSVKMIKKQINWTEMSKNKTWTLVIKEKINNQAKLLTSNFIDTSEMLEQYAREIQLGDITNREGHAAKVYFNSLFGLGFTRDEETPINAMLNFGYSILLSLFTREITSSGYITQLGIFHDNQFNYYNLASDFMEPMRPLVDRIVYEHMPEKFTMDEKIELLKMMDENCIFKNRNCTLINAITFYCRSLFEALETGESEKIEFIKYEL